MRLAYYGHRMRMCDGWTQFGFETGPRGEEAYRNSRGIPRSTWYRAVRIGQAFHQLPLWELERIPIENANTLLAVNPIIFNDYNWTQEARTKSNEELALLVTERNRLIGDNREPLTAMIFRVPVLARKALDKMLDGFMKKHELSSKSQALECLIADRHDQANLAAGIHKARTMVAASLRLLRDKNAIQGTDADEWLKLATEVLDEVYEKAVQGTREKPKNVQDAGGRP